MRFSKLIPELSVSNIVESLRFYRDIIGFNVEYSRPKEKFYFLSIDSAQLMIEERSITIGGQVSWFTHLAGASISRSRLLMSPLLLRGLRKRGSHCFVHPKKSGMGGMGWSLVRSSFLFRTRMDTC